MFKFFMITLFAMNSYAGLGNDAGGGGKSEELEFAQIAQVFLSNLERSRKTEDLFKDFDIAAFQQAITKTEVKSKEHLCTTSTDLTTGATNTHCLDAQYLRNQNLIEMSLRSWKSKTCTEKMGLAVHEYGRAAGTEDGNYKYSSLVRMSGVMSNACASHERDGQPTPVIPTDLPDEAGAWLLSVGTKLVPRTNIVLPAKTRSFLICGNQLTTSEDLVPSYKGCDKVPLQNSQLALCRFDLGVARSQAMVWGAEKAFPIVHIEKRSQREGGNEISEYLAFGIHFTKEYIKVECAIYPDLQKQRTRAMTLGELKVILGQFLQIVQIPPKEM